MKTLFIDCGMGAAGDMLTRLQPKGKKWYADMNKPYLIKFYFIAAIALSGLKTFDTFLRALHAFLP